MNKQNLLAWEPIPEMSGKKYNFADMNITSPEQEKLAINLVCYEGEIILRFDEVRAFWMGWDGDPNPFVSFTESSQGPSWFMKVENSSWLTSGHFTLDIESSRRYSEPSKRWEHFYVLAEERSIHIAARDKVEAIWMPIHSTLQ